MSVARFTAEGQSRSDQEPFRHSSLTSNRSVHTNGHVQGTVRSRTDAFKCRRIELGLIVSGSWTCSYWKSGLKLISFSFQENAIVQVVSCWSLVRVWLGTRKEGRLFSGRFKFTYYHILPILHVHFGLNSTLIRRTRIRNLGCYYTAMFVWIFGSVGYKVF